MNMMNRRGSLDSNEGMPVFVIATLLLLATVIGPAAQAVDPAELKAAREAYERAFTIYSGIAGGEHGGDIRAALATYKAAHRRKTEIEARAAAHGLLEPAKVVHHPSAPETPAAPVKPAPVQSSPGNAPPSSPAPTIGAGESPEAPAGTPPDPLTASLLAMSPTAPPPAAAPEWLVDFEGFDLDDPCNPAAWTMKGAPWGGDDEVADGIAPPAPPESDRFDPAACRDATMRAMEVVRHLVGPLDGKADDCFDRLWAPFFDHPTPETHAWFKAAAPLLESWLAINADLARAQAFLGESAIDAAGTLVAGDPAEQAPAAQSLAASTLRLLDLGRAREGTAERLAALKDPPNPLKGKCGARTRHRRALQSLAPARGPIVKLSWPGFPLGDRFGLPFGSVEGFIKKGRSCGLRDGTVTWIAYDSTVPSRARAAFLIVDRQRFSPTADTGPLGVDIVEQIGDFTNWGADLGAVARSLVIDGYRAKVHSAINRFEEMYHPEDGAGPLPRFEHHLAIDLGIPGRYCLITITVDARWEDDGSLRYLSVAGVPTREGTSLIRGVEAFADHLRIERLATLPEHENLGSTPGSAGKGSVPPPSAAASPAAAPASSPDPDPATELRERLAERQAVIDQYERFIALAEAERAGAKGDRVAALGREIESLRDTIEAERMHMKSLETGKMEYWRSAFAERQMRAIEAQARAEVEALAEESDLFREANGLVRVASRLGSGATASDRLAAIGEAVKASDRLARLRALTAAWRAETENRLAVDRRAAKTEIERANLYDQRLAAAETLKAGSDLLLAGGALFAGPPAAALMLGHAGATGFLEGGLGRGLLAMARFKSDAVDVVASGVEGFVETERVKTASGAVETRIRGMRGAAERGLEALLVNLGFNKAGEFIRARKNAADRAKAARRPDPAFEKHLDNAERMDLELERATSDDARASVRKRFEVIDVRGRMKAEMSAGASLETVAAKPEFAGWNGRRVAEHDAALAACGMSDAHYSGGKPSNPLSDIDVTPPDDATGRRFVERLRYGGEPPKPGETKEPARDVVEYDDRWVVPSTDTTVWKRGPAAGRAGTSAADAETALKAQAGSDQFATPGGLHFTTGGRLGAYDPEGAFLDNFKKMLDGLEKRGGPDYHAVGKSVDKVLDVVGDLPSSLGKHADRKFLPPALLGRLKLDVDPARLADLRAKARALRGHRSPVEAGIVTPGMSAGEAKRALDGFVDEAKGVMGRAHEICAAASGVVNTGRAAARANLLAAGNTGAAGAIRSTQAHVASTNAEMTRALIARDPDTCRSVLGSRHAAPPVAPEPSRRGVSWLLPERERPAARPVDHPPLVAVGRRMADAGATLGRRLALLPPGDPARPHLEALKSALDAGAAAPLVAQEKLRLLTGDEPGKVLEELERALAKTNGK